MKATAAGIAAGAMAGSSARAGASPAHCAHASRAPTRPPGGPCSPQVRSLTTDAVVNESADPGLLLKRYERQIKELKQELAMRDALRCGPLQAALSVGVPPRWHKLWTQGACACRLPPRGWAS